VPKIAVNLEKIKNILRRAAWFSIALLFLISGVGIGVYYFWLATRQSDQNQSESQNLLTGKPLANFTPVDKVNSLQKIDQKIGTGSEVKADSTVTVVYTGAVASNGIVFESTADTGRPATFKLDQVIKGWQEGLLGMRVGGERRLLIPSDLAYGPNPPPGSKIPPNADLVFDITVLLVK
jgi:FKBP-type peptidyl-prolyl cis-trans isomerase